MTKDHINCAVLFLLTFLTFSNIFHNQFVMDDYDFVVDWPLIQSWANFPRFFISYVPPDGQAGVYSPLKTLFHAISYHLFGLNPFGYHVVSLLVHFISVVFVYRICLLLTEAKATGLPVALASVLARGFMPRASGDPKGRPLTKVSWTAFAAASLFALHPVQVEAITYITASVDMMGVMFLFIAFDFYARGKDESSKRRAWLFAALAIFTHELTISLPLLFLWYELCFRQEKEGLPVKIRRVCPYFMFAAAYVLAKYFVLGSLTRGGYLYGSFYLTMLVIVKALVDYVWICSFPLVLTVNHIISDGIFSYGPEDFNRAAVLSQSIWDAQTFSAIVALGIIFYFVVRYFKQKPLVSFCIGWFFLSLVPAANIIPSGIYFGERYLYPGLLGFCLLAAIFLEKISRKNIFGADHKNKYLGTAILSLIVIFYSGRAYLRNQDWKTEITFYESAVKENPQSAFMRRDLAIIYLNHGQSERAAAALQEAIRLKSEDPDLYFTLANIYLAMTRYQDAQDALLQAIRLNPEFPEAYYNLAGIYASEGKKNDARAHLAKALELYRRQEKFIEAYETHTALRNYFGSI